MAVVIWNYIDPLDGWEVVSGSFRKGLEAGFSMACATALEMAASRSSAGRA